VLVIHLKRFSYGGIIGKISKAITFEFKISLSSVGQDKNLYNLIGIVVHHGSSIHSGHYVAFVKVRDPFTFFFIFWSTY
jgi:ubiquitin carboxyl-terminal hydrolase 36/42